MWTMTTRGFFSAVQHRDDPNLLVVRARDRSDAETLKDWYEGHVQRHLEMSARHGLDVLPWPAAEVLSYAVSDYPWRVIMPKVAWATFLVEAVEDLDYGNFKDAVKKVPGQGADRARVYTRVWSALLELEDLDPQGRIPSPFHTWGELPEDWDAYDQWEAEQDDAGDEWPADAEPTSADVTRFLEREGR